LISLREDLDFSTLSGNLIFNVMASVAEYERNLIRERQLIGIEEAKKKGLYKGRKPVPVPDNFQQCFEKYKNSTRAQKYTLKMFAQETNLKMSTLLNFITRFRVNW
jgi:DNA invertase Pin-like site-specific DNA recombinase